MKKFLIPAAILILALIITGCSSATTYTPAPQTPATTTPAVTTQPAASTAPVTTTSAATKPAVTSPTATSPATSTAAASGKSYGGILRSIETMGPATPIGWPAEATGSSGGTMGISLQGLLAEMADGSIVPLLAESFQTNPDPKAPSITFKLRKGVKFQDGTDLNAQAVKWNFETTKASPVNASITGPWKSFDIIDDYTIRVNFTAWQNLLTRSFTGMAGVLVSPTAYQKNGADWMRTHMVGTGAFTQTDYQRDVTLKTAKNANYWESGKPYLDGIQLLYVTDELTRIALFKSGGGDLMGVSPRVANDLQAAGYKMVTQQGGATSLIPDSANADSPWSNLKVRQAAEYAIDKDSISKTFGYGYWKTAYQLPDPSSPAYISSLEGRKYDVAKAKQLLTDAGYPNGFKTQIIAPVTADMNIILAIQSSLTKAGIQTDLNIMDVAKYTATYTGTWKNALIYVALYWYPNFNAISNFYFRVPASTNFQSLKKPDAWADSFTASVSSATLDPKLMQKMNQVLYDDATLIPLYYGMSIWATTDNVHDSQGTRGGSGFWDNQNTWLSK